MSFVLQWYFFRHLILSSRAGALVRRISFLSFGAISLSVFAFLVVLFVMTGMNASIKDRLIALEPHIVISVPGAKTAEQVAKEPRLEELAADGRLRTAFYESQDVILRSLDGQFQGAVARGVDENGLRDFLQEIQRLQIQQVASVEDSPVVDPPGEGEVLIGLDLARQLGLFEGDQLLVIAPESLLLPVGEAPRTEKVRIKKIVGTNLADLDAQLFMYVRGKALRTLAASPARRAGLEIRLANGDRADAWKREFGDSRGLQVETWGERNSALFFALKMEKLMIGVFLGLAGLIAGSSILTVMTLLLSQKRRDIALLRVLGLSAQRAVRTFTQMGLGLAGSAVLLGVILGAISGIWIEHHPLRILPGDIYYDAEIPSRFDAGLTVVTLLVSLGLAFLGAWIPSRRVADVEPTTVLRQKN